MIEHSLLPAVLATFAVAGCSAAQPIAVATPDSAVVPASAARPQGPMASENVWSAYQNYTFSADSNEIMGSDSGKSSEIANHLGQNPTMRVGLDGANDDNVVAVRDALITAGVPAAKIRSGAFGDAQSRRDGYVAVLLSN
jgi:hypothetical protein